MSIMRGCLKDLPTYHWLTVLSQLVSRICHQNDEIVRLVKHIITSVLQEYPQQALWIMAAVSKSTVAERRNAAAEIIQAARKGSQQGSDINGLFIQFASLIDHLIRLCFHAGQAKARTINISTEFSALKRMMPLGIIMPIQQALTVTLPTYDASPTNSKFDVFSAADHPTISGITDEAEILSSLQRPKKVWANNTENSLLIGLGYLWMCWRMGSIWSPTKLKLEERLRILPPRSSTQGHIIPWARPFAWPASGCDLICNHGCAFGVT